jgi:hypothetical protein
MKSMIKIRQAILIYTLFFCCVSFWQTEKTVSDKTYFNGPLSINPVNPRNFTDNNGKDI